MYVLAGTIGNHFVQLTLKMGRYRFGRGAKNDVDLEDLSVSREHAELIIGPEGVILQDLGSSNGTFLNEARITEAVAIGAGDQVRFGALKFTLLKEKESRRNKSDPQTDSDLTIAMLSDQKDVSERGRLTRDETGDALNLVSVFDQILFRAVTEAGLLLVLPQPLSEIFDKVLQLVEQVIPARRILLLMADSTDEALVVRAARSSSPGDGEKLVLSKTLLATVLRKREAFLLNDAMEDPRFKSQESIIRQKVRSAMVAPLFDNEQVIGLLYADNDDERFRYDGNQLRAFTLLANLIAVKITNTRLLESERDKHRIEQEVAAAAKVQQGLLLMKKPQIPGYEVMARQVPCFEVAGDLYDVTTLDDGRIALVVGDVTGKGMPAAMLMSNAIAALRVLYQECPEPAVLADRLHRELWRSSSEIHYVTLFFGLLDPKNHRMEYVNAGHNPPMLLCEDDKCVTLGPTGMPMGLIEDAKYRVESFELPHCCMLCLFTDGITEAMVDDNFYGEERLLASLRQRCRHPLQEVADGVIWDLRAFLGENLLQDDVTMLLLRRPE